jgi:hypothetical protein
VRVIENDGSFITVQNLDARWTIAEITQRHQDRIARALIDAGLWAGSVDPRSDDWLVTELNPMTAGETGEYFRLPADVAFTMVQLPIEVRDHISRELAGDYRESVGKSRTDAKNVKSITRRRSLEEWADEFSIPTNGTFPGWKAAVVDAIVEAPSRGQVDG